MTTTTPTPEPPAGIVAELRDRADTRAAAGKLSPLDAAFMLDAADAIEFWSTQAETQYALNVALATQLQDERNEVDRLRREVDRYSSEAHDAWDRLWSATNEGTYRKVGS